MVLSNNDVSISWNRIIWYQVDFGFPWELSVYFSTASWHEAKCVLDLEDNENRDFRGIVVLGFIVIWFSGDRYESEWRDNKQYWQGSFWLRLTSGGHAERTMEIPVYVRNDLT